MNKVIYQVIRANRVDVVIAQTPKEAAELFNDTVIVNPIGYPTCLQYGVITGEKDGFTSVA